MKIHYYGNDYAQKRKFAQPKKKTYASNKDVTKEQKTADSGAAISEPLAAAQLGEEAETEAQKKKKAKAKKDAE